MAQFQIYVKGFGRSTGQQQLKKLFSSCGEVKEVRIIRDYAFIVFNNADDVQKAVQTMNDTNFGDYKLKVQVADNVEDWVIGISEKYLRKNDCPEFRGSDSRRRRRRSYSSSSSSSQSSSSDRKHRKKHKSKKISKKHRKKSASSSSGSSSSHSISSQQKLRERNKKEKKGNE